MIKFLGDLGEFMKKLFLFIALFITGYASGQKGKADFITFPDYPAYNNVITEFFTRYKAPTITQQQVLSFIKKPDGWHTIILEKWPVYREIWDELFWSRSFGVFLDIGYEKLQKSPVKVTIPHEFIDQEDSLSCSILPYWGYVGWEEDIIHDFGAT